MRHLFDLDSPVMSALSTLLDFFVLSILTLLCSLPVVTAGASWCALYSSMVDMVAGAPMHIRGYFSHFRQLFKPATKCWVAILALAYLFYLDFQAIGSLPPSVQLFFWGGVLFLVFCLLMASAFLPPGNQRQSLPSLPAAVEGGPSPRHWAAAPVSGNFGSAGHPCCSAVLLSPVVLAADFRVVFLVASSSGLPVGPTYGSAIRASGQLINKGRRLTFSKTLKPASLCQNGVGRTPISIHSFFEQGDIPTSLPCRKRIAVAPLAAAIFTRK